MHDVATLKTACRSARLSLLKGWESLSLSSQFIAAASAVLLTAMALLGTWVSTQIERRVVELSAISTAFYMDSMIEPLIQRLARGTGIDASEIAQLDAILRKGPIDKSIASIKVWNLAGTIVYSTGHDEIGQSFPDTASFKIARTGKIVSEFDDLSDDVDASERKLNRSILEVFAPIHEAGTSRVIAVAQMYQFGDGLHSSIAKTRWNTFLVIGSSTLAMLGLLYTIVRRGNQTIILQRQSLEQQITDLSALLKQNEELNRNVVAARKMTTEMNERLLRRVGAELHDGPAQLMGLALLYYDGLRPTTQPAVSTANPQSANGKFESVRGLMQESLSEIRNISSDIAPPHLERLSPVQTIELAIRNHEKRTALAVRHEIGPIRADITSATKTCLYRFVQEGLNNAFRYAAGARPTVSAQLDQNVLTVEIMDQGPGFDSAQPTEGLGLAGLADRIEACEGILIVTSSPDAGTRLTANFVLRA